jgi:hypothetical protein
MNWIYAKKKYYCTTLPLFVIDCNVVVYWVTAI